MRPFAHNQHTRFEKGRPGERETWRCLKIAALLFLSLSPFLPVALSEARAATVVTASLTITNAANFTGTAGQAFAIGADKRTWTNSVVDPATQILTNSTLAGAGSNMLFQVSSYPFANVVILSFSPSNITFRALPDAGLTITLTGTTWGKVTYSTGTLASAVAVRVPYTVEAANIKTNVASGLVDWLNIAANTNAIDPTATVASGLVGLTNAQTVAGSKSLTNQANVFVGASLETIGYANVGTYLQSSHAALAIYSSPTNFVANFTDAAYQTITATNHIFFIMSTNRAAVRSLVVFIDPQGTNRNFGVNASWKLLSTLPTVVTNGTIGILSLTVKGTAETDVYAAYSFAQ